MTCLELQPASLSCILNTEIGAVLAVMRRNVRWGTRFTSADDQQEHSLIHSLKVLRKKLFTWRDHWHIIDPVIYLRPFLDVIQSEETGAPITSVALSSVYKILTLDIFDMDTINIQDTMHFIVDAVTSCHFEVTDPASEEVVLMKILQVLLACTKCKASVALSNQHVCNIVETCFRVVQQTGAKSELLQRIARHSMHELVRSIFARLPELDSVCHELDSEGSLINHQIQQVNHDPILGSPQPDSNDNTPKYSRLSVTCSISNSSTPLVDGLSNGTATMDAEQYDSHLQNQQFGVPCMVEILQFLCSLLNIIEHADMSRKSNSLAFDEDVPFFALSLINSAIELGGASFQRHPSLLNLIQDNLFCHLMQFGMSMSPLILSMVCSIVLNLYQHLRTKLKLQLEAFFSSVILRLAQSRYGASYQQQEVAMEALVDFCRQKTFIMEMYANFDCDLTSKNVFEELINLLSKSAFPVNTPLSSMHILALEGLIAVIQGMAERASVEHVGLGNTGITVEEYKPFWLFKCDSYEEPCHWVPFLRQTKYIKRRLMAGADHFNRDPKKGLEFLQSTHLLPGKLDAQSVACFLRYTAGLDKNIVGDFLGNHEEFSVQVLNEFAQTFDFKGMSMDTALRIFLETFRLPGEAQKIQRVLEAFSARYYEQSPHILANKDAALLLSYSIILLNTDLHNSQVKKKMTVEDFIRNNRHINGGNDLPRELLSELYRSICKDEIRITPEQGSGSCEMRQSHWIDLMQKSQNTSPYIAAAYKPYLDDDMFAIVAGPTVAAISVVFDHAEDEDVYQLCTDGFLAAAKIAAYLHLDSVLDDIVISLCKFTTLLNPSYLEEFLLAYSNDTRARMSTIAVFTIANSYGDCIRTGWQNILNCILRFYEFGFLSAFAVCDAADEPVFSATPGHVKPLANSSSSPHIQTSVAPKKPSGLMGRFSQLLSFETEEPISQPSEEELAAQQCTKEIVQKCQINNIFTESKFLQADSLMHLVCAIVAAEQIQTESGYPEDEANATFCLDLLIAVTLNNRDRISLLWKSVYEHISNIVQSTMAPCVLVEKAVFGLLRICQRLLPYKEDLVDELLRSLQLVLKLDARVADAYCEQITQEVGQLVKTNANRIRSQIGWRIILSLLAITARHPEASEAGFETLSFIMSEGAHLLPSNFVLCIDGARQFAESRVGEVERSVHALDLMSGSLTCLVRWALESQEITNEDDAAMLFQDIGEMWFRLVQGLKKLCLDDREAVRNHALLSLQKCLSGAQDIHLSHNVWLQCFDVVMFPLLTDVLEIALGQSSKMYRNIEAMLVVAIKLLSKVFLLSFNEVMQLPTFCDLWITVLSQMETYMMVKIRGKKSEKLQELVPELLKNSLLIMKTRGVLIPGTGSGGDSLWEITWSHVNKIAPSLQAEVFSDADLDRGQHNQIKKEAIQGSACVVSTPSNPVALEG
ncbi:ARF guanine-nucleotide exchange factor GNOM-like [Chenopodium quinoa]|uniref:ARF guanine-nucleotide exchange factor GNOM-like n=1 Tax=Chenopodium quinoa TaxID=63459 RepID=UPI000B79382C|nr:ARF guanine-nucleotide exchange factor GNOM-like [Chenopodium quinoa]